MKRFFGFALMLALLAAPAFAGGKTQKVTFGTPVQVGSTQVAPGVYDLTYSGTGSNVQVTLAREQENRCHVSRNRSGRKHNGREWETYNHGGSGDTSNHFPLGLRSALRWPARRKPDNKRSRIIAGVATRVARHRRGPGQVQRTGRRDICVPAQRWRYAGAAQAGLRIVELSSASRDSSRWKAS